MKKKRNYCNAEGECTRKRWDIHSKDDFCKHSWMEFFNDGSGGCEYLGVVTGRCGSRAARKAAGVK